MARAITISKSYPNRTACPAMLVGVTTAAAAALALVLPGTPVWAQSSGIPTGSGLSNLPSLTRTTDIFVGRDNPGPYVLNWKKLPVVNGDNAPVVNVDGRELRASEYTVDFDKGTITFTAPLKQASMARVDYGRDGVLSERNQSPSSSPVTVPLFKAGGTNFQLTAVPTGSAAAPAAQQANKTRAMSLLGAVAPASGASSQQMPDTTLVLGGGGKTNLLGGGLTSQMYLSPQVKDAKGDGLFDRAGMALGYSRNQGRFGLDASWGRTGRDFAPAVGKSLGMGDAAQQKQSLAARYNASAWMGLEWGQTQVRNLLGTASGATGQDRFAMRFGGVKNAPTLNLSRVEDKTSTGAGALTAVITEKADLAAKLGPTTSLTARTQQVSKDAPNAPQDTSASETALALNTQSKDKSQAASISFNETSQETSAAVQENQNIQLKLQASPSVTITASQQQQTVTPIVASTEAGKPAEPDPSKAQQTSQQAARAEIAVMPGAKLVTGVSLNAVGENKTAATEMGAQFGLGKNVDVAQTIITRSANEGVTDASLELNTRRTQIALRPSKTFSLSGALTTNPVTNGKPVEAKQQELSMKATVGSFDVGSGYTITSLASASDARTGEFSLTFGLTFDKKTKLTGAYKDALLWGAEEDCKLSRGARTYTLGLTRNLGDAMNFTFGGSVTENKQDTTVPNDIKAQAKLGLKF